MALFKCKMCGGDLEIQEGITVCECEYCGTKQTIPALDNEKKLNLFNRANRLRLNSEFDKAANIYESIIAEFPEEAEGYWGLVLCNYGIEYVDDPATARKIPTCHRAAFESVTKDENYEMALEYADVVSQKVYRDEAREIDRIMSEILSISKTEKPYDIFICYKETDMSGGRTIDSVIAQDVYDALTDKGYRVFFSRISLEDKLGKQYEPYIFAALNSAKVMLAFGTKYEYFQAVWVKNEWSRFLKLMAKDKSKTLVPCYKDMDAYDIPDEFKALQAQDMGKVGAIQDLLRGIEKLVPKNTIPSVKTVASENHGAANREIAYSDGYYVGDAVAEQPNGFGTRVWTDNTKYEGEWKFGKMNGKGTYFFANGDKYEGEFVNDKRTGKGIYYYANGEKIEGEFKDGTPYTGNGYWEYDDGGYYKGSFVKGICDGFGTEVYPDGEKYEGQYVNGKRTGKGVICWSDGDKYEGEFVDGNLTGKGTYHFANGEKIEGEFKNDEPYNCTGYWEFDDGIYTGSFVNGKLSGNGVYVWDDCTKYEGEFKNDKLEGNGIYHHATGEKIEGEFKNGSPYNCTGYWEYDNGTYIGTFVNGCKSGQGVQTWNNGDKYEGEFVNDKRSGKGVYVYGKSGNTYEGEFANDAREGNGTLYYKNGEKIEGEFKHDKPYNCNGFWRHAEGGYYKGTFVNGNYDGFGTEVFNNGDKYEGQYVNGKRTGKGTYIYFSGAKYEGDFKNNKFEGKGTYYYLNGKKYEGEFVDDKRTGKGTYHFANGEKIEGEFKDGEPHNCSGYWEYSNGYYKGPFVNGERTGKGAYVWKSGDKYEGDFISNKRSGKGTYYYKNGDKYEGMFLDGVRKGHGTFTNKDGSKWTGEFNEKGKPWTGRGTWYFSDGSVRKGVLKEGKKVKTTKIIAVSVIAIVIIVSILFTVIKNAVIIPNEKYNNAVDLMNQGKTVEAYEALIALEGYKDSAALADSIYFDYKTEKLKSAKVGEYVLWGSYEQDNDGSNGEEAIEWYVLEKQDDRILVVSRYALDCQQYNIIDTDITWEACTLRTWLNEEFIDTAFTDEETAMIPTVTVVADETYREDVDCGNDTQDKIFILSETEMEKYNVYGECEPTAYTVANGAYDAQYGGGCWYWLRSPGDYQNHVDIVLEDGRISSDITNYDNLSVRPAMWLEIG